MKAKTLHDSATKVKICGITSLEDALAACEAGADAIGFNFAEEAKKRCRYIEPDEARAIAAQLPPLVMVTAVCVNEPSNRLRYFLSFCDRVQLHGEEPAEQCNNFGARAIKVFRAGPGFQIESMRDYRVGAYLLDAWAPDARGGTGKTLDWDIAEKAVSLGKPIILAGGLTPDNVAEAVRRVRPYAVDTAGGVESAPGKKDHAKLRSFVENAKRALLAAG
ncbi:MAG: phosphoribosylanthranilate isomerase [Candidatus Hydrogenedentes bacterium]|nr:phosphoribosylanthranilate isomerase [Candidatus Hydrogenedentota bacterium]